jgi:hypothetical protein
MKYRKEVSRLVGKFARHPPDTHTMDGAIIEKFVLVIAPDDGFAIHP